MPLFTPFSSRGLTLRNRIVVSPMCQYSSSDGFATDWHLVHLGSRAVGGAGLVFTEATAVTAQGRISPEDLGIWKDDHVEMLARIASFVHSQGAPIGIQFAHAGRKASTRNPWMGRGASPPEEGGWDVVGPSAIAFSPAYPPVSALTIDEITEIVDAFAAAAKRAVAAGFDLVELHAAHGYLLHEFFSPLSNARTDQYGGSLENRMRIVIECATAIRRAIPDTMPLWTRISATDWIEGGWTIDDSVELARALKSAGVDLIDVSTGGNVEGAAIPVGPGYQVPFAEQIRRDAEIPTGAVGMITDAAQADAIISTGQADVVLLARQLLRDPYWPLHAAKELSVDVEWPKQYGRAKQ